MPARHDHSTDRVDAFDEREYAILEFLEQIARKMQADGIKRSTIAARIGKSKAYVTKLMNGPNMTFGTAAHLAKAVGLEFHTSCLACPQTIVISSIRELAFDEAATSAIPAWMIDAAASSSTSADTKELLGEQVEIE
jgi:transcriptional regulator with XRE-family HTH domain